MAVAKQRRPAKRERPPVTISDPRTIKALAHPARLAVIDALFGGGEMTATECAHLAGLTPSAMSYHLRALEKWGIVERAETSADGRERPWRAAGRGLRVDSAQPRASAVAEAVLVNDLLDRTRHDVLEWLAADRDRQGRWAKLASVGSGIYWLTTDEAQALNEAVNGWLVKLGPEARGRPDGSQRVRVAFVLVPTDAAGD